MGTTADELKRQLAVERGAVSRDLEAIGDRVSPNRIAQRRSAAVRQRFVAAKDRVMGAADGATSSVHDAASNVADGMSSTVANIPQQARQTTQGNPLAVGLIAFGAGLVVATLLPESESEQRLVSAVQPQLEHAASSAGEAAQEVAESVKPAMQEAAQDLQQHAQSAASTVKDTAQQTVSATGHDARQTVEETLRH